MMKEEQKKRMVREIVGTMGICLIGFAVTTYFQGWFAGACVGLTLVGAGLVIDALKK